MVKSLDLITLEAVIDALVGIFLLQCGVRLIAWLSSYFIDKILNFDGSQKLQAIQN